MRALLPPVAPRTAIARDFLARSRSELFIGGRWQEPFEGGRIASVDPATGAVMTEIGRGTAHDIDEAVLAARRAFPGWAARLPAERAAILTRLADLIEARIDAIAEIETLDQGKAFAVGRWAEIPGAIAQFRYFAAMAVAIEGQTIAPSIGYQPEGREVRAWTVREPVGVVGAIVPWNSPFVLTAMKLAPALAAGCTVILKPAEDTSLSALLLAELAEEAGIPPGVLNVVTGLGSEAGAALAAHAGVDKLAFTGSAPTARCILDAARGNLKRVSLELGGKSPAIVLADADPALAVPGVANAIFFNAGQVCVAASRLYVHRSIEGLMLEGLAATAEAMPLGHGLNPATEMGPLVSPRHAEKVARHVADARAAGGEIVTGGRFLDERCVFFEPTVITRLPGSHPAAREEIFGPVIVVDVFDDAEEVIHRANDSEYGLSASIWTENIGDAHRLSRRIEAGIVWINSHSMFDPALPVGGVKQSGWGRDSGRQALDNYLEWKTICAVI
jgi:phenylacetaldehyde dehydrogenase